MGFYFIFFILCGVVFGGGSRRFGRFIRGSRFLNNFFAKLDGRFILGRVVFVFFGGRRVVGGRRCLFA